MTPEGKIKDQVKRLLVRYGAYWHMPIQNGLGAPSLDFICCHRGRYFAIETKAPGGKPTQRQLLTMASIEKASGRAFVVDGSAQSLAAVEEFLTSC